MAYTLGFIFADGSIEDVRNSSRTCYIQFSSKDRLLIEQIRSTLSSSHNIYVREARETTFFSKKYMCQKLYNLRIGNKNMYQDLIKKGLTPRKSLTMKLPFVPNEYFNFFLRGYFDGDGCLSVYTKPNQKAKIAQLIFISGSYEFLEQLSFRLHKLLGTSLNNYYKNTRSSKISYRKRDSLKILSFMYEGLKSAPCLERKYNKYKDLLAE